ncbi:hypothetical protein Pmani_020492 [Petrolisthes manimaculis]|uniref:NACHT domain-containing protein n=1 Tax=Petrolisthes manimaculis TaxID=1843537 RepID=A0AAE1PI90_9EUCA|nr:hypothetical protein Pmani_020492 [Petrolisthes manimaculis]
MSSDPSCRTGDITLLHKLFMLFALNVAKFNDPKWNNKGGTHLESLLTRIKDIRNKVAHEECTLTDTEFGNMGAKLRLALIDALKEAKERYNISEVELQRKTDEMIDGLFKVFNQVFGMEELLYYHQPTIMKELIKEAKVHIAETASVIIDPLHFLPDSGIKIKVPDIFSKIQVSQKDTRGANDKVKVPADIFSKMQVSQKDTTDTNDKVKVPDIFSKMQVSEKDTTDTNDKVKVPADIFSKMQVSQKDTTDTNDKVKVPDIFSKMQVSEKDTRGANDILSVINPSISKPQLLLLVGEAGSGKSTLLTMITYEWLEGGQGYIKGLDKYSLVLRVQCRDRHLNSLTDFLNNALPKVYCRYKDLMQPIMKGCSILFLIDGIDEENTQSRKLVEEILNVYRDAANITLLFTSRPEPITHFRTTIPTQYEVSEINLLGIDKKDRKTFIFNYINAFKHIKDKTVDFSKDKTVDFSKLQQTIETICIQDHFKIALNLVFLAWQCIHDPSSVTASESQTQLYFWAHKLNVQKLTERLLKKKPDLEDIGVMELTRRVEKCVEALYQSMLQALINNRVVFTQQELLQITSTCDTFNISSQEVLSVFFTMKTTRTPLGDEHQYSALHKAVQEYYGALHVVKQLKLKPETTTIKEEIISALGPRPFIVKDFQYIFLHLVGLLHHYISPVPIQLHEEVVQLLHKAGVDNWGKIVEAAECNTGVINVIIHQHISPDRGLCVENHVKGHAALLSYMKPTQVTLTFFLSYTPDLTPMIQALTHHNVTSVQLFNNYNSPQQTTQPPDLFQQALMAR